MHLANCALGLNQLTTFRKKVRGIDVNLKKKLNMHKLVADAIFMGEGELLENHMLVVNPEGLIEDLVSCSEEDIPADALVYEGILCPGFINSHCHLELSWMRGKLSEINGINDFIPKISSLKHADDNEKFVAMQQAEQEMKRNGIVAVADISNSALSFPVKNKSQIYYYTFIELFGSRPELASQIYSKGFSLLEELKKNLRNNDGQLVPHAPYSLSKPLLEMLSDNCNEHPGLISIHHQESESENQLFETRDGPMLQRFFSMGLAVDEEIFNGQRPWQLVEKYFQGNYPVLFVHNTFSELQDLQCVQQAFDEPWFCICPNSNLNIENRLPDIFLFQNISDRVVLGSDSLASNHHISILEEIKTLKRVFPMLSLETLLSWGTGNGAKLLGLHKRLGFLKKGFMPGVNLIEGYDMKNEVFLAGAKVRPLVECKAFKV
jgi:aminodeoxyfutalosine deaminase